MFLVHLFVYCGRFNFCPFSLPLGVSDWLRHLTVALPGLLTFFYLIQTSGKVDDVAMPQLLSLFLDILMYPFSPHPFP